MKKTIVVSGIKCGSCEQKISERLKKLHGVTGIVVDRKKNTVEIASHHSIENSDISSALKEIGDYKIVSEAPERRSFQEYAPLIAVIGYILGATLLLFASSEHRSLHRAMNYFMGSFFVGFSLFKVLDVKGFADGFATYDLIAKRSRTYALAYPFIELTLGVLYLLELFPLTTNIATATIMTISFVGVAQSLFKGSPFQCACLGTVLKVPLSKITLFEDGIMASMASFAVFTLLT